MKRLQYILLLAELLISTAVYAGWNVPVTNYAVADYAAGTQNWQLVTTANGWLYAANNYGLLEYDGSQWRVYGMYYGNLPRSIAQVDNRAVFIGATNDFGVFTPTSTGGMRYTSLMSGEIEPNYGEIWDIEIVGNQVYFFARHQIITAIVESRKSIRSEGVEEDSVWLRDVRTIKVDSRVFCAEEVGEAIYVGTDNGLYLLTGTRMNRIHGSDILRGYEVRCIQTLDAERLLIATDLGGLFVYDGTRIAPFRTDADTFIKKNQLYTFAVRGETIALGTVLQGIAVVNTEGKGCRYISRKEGLQNNTILSMTFDSDDNLWVGLDQGIDYVQLASLKQYFSDPQTNIGTGYAVLRAGEDRQTRYYYATNQGLYMCTSVDAPMRLVEGSMGQVWSLSEIDGTVFCCHNRGLFVVSDGRVQPLSTDEGFWKVQQLPDGRIIAGCYSGFRVVERSSISGQRSAVSNQWTVTKVKGFDDTAFRWQIDGTGVIWAVGISGVVRLNWQDAYTLHEQPVHAYNAAHNWINISRLGKEILISSRDYCRVVGADGVLRHDSTFVAQLGGEDFYSLTYQDSHGNILYVRDGTLYIRMREGDNYHPEQPLYSGATDFVGGFENLYENDGSYIIGTLQGYCRLQPSAISHQQSVISGQQSAIRPTIYLREVSVMNMEGEVVYGESPGCRRTNGELFVLPYAEHTLLFRCAINRVPAANTQYAYRLSPRDKEFTPFDTRAYYECSMLREGRYTLEVICRTTSDGLSPEQVRQAWTFSILPPWYRTWWARTLLVLIIVLWLTGVGYVLYVRVDRSKRRMLHEQQLRILQLENDKTQMRLQAKSQELTRILHDEANRQEEFVFVTEELNKAIRELQGHNVKKADERLQALRQHMEQDNRDDSIDWQRFEENYDEVNAGFCKRLTEMYPWMNKQERKLCIYIRMGMLTKEMAPLLGMSTRGVEMLRYRMRCKMDLDAQANLKDHLTKITSNA